MTDREKIISDVIWAFSEWENNMCCPGDDWSDVHQSRDMVIALLKAQEPIEARLHLCDSCTKLYPECDATADGIEFGCGVGNDNIIGCTAYENRWKAQP